MANTTITSDRERSALRPADAEGDGTAQPDADRGTPDPLPDRAFTPALFGI
ncbi:hypothetical protein [Amycolatopsis methanolica]|uniref:Uncharacterized protein n=1 Tax=Amycolatopsis methanolica 239 TaxID=1068978 RepID=A0A076MTD0_AMYME|nr:hypothetical protein [Amycolatopsis methanolica]AIJ23959.1 hypothetical protein AMETH_3867 [Amycolatopsis methanolica 239]